MEVGRRNHWSAAIGLLILIGLLSTACSSGLDVPPATGQQRQSFPVDPIFKEFYQTLGGQDILGPAITGLEFRENLQCQFTERALMCFNPAVTDANRFSLYPLGRELKIQEDTFLTSTSSATGARVVDGFVIYEKFQPLYDRLYGARYVGRPLTELRINHELQRVEQFFENVGFYQSLNDPDGPVYLIPYGAYLCGGTCSYRLNEYWSIVKSNHAEQPFAASVARLGGPAVFGELLLKPQVAEDGYLQQVYANAIFYAPQDHLALVRLRPLPLILGYETQPLTGPISHENLVFYEIEGGLGHNVPRPFDTFIALHGGRDLSGAPLSEVMKLPDQDLFRQCFENYCLLYDPSAPETMMVRMAPLGEEYTRRFPAPEELQLRDLFSPQQILLTVSVDKPNINENEPQYVRMVVQQASTGQPIERVEGSLVLSFLNRPPIRYPFPPTGADGLSIVEVPPQSGLPNGSRVSYQVCLNLPSEQPICRVDSYLIWNIQP